MRSGIAFESMWERTNSWNRIDEKKGDTRLQLHPLCAVMKPSVLSYFQLYADVATYLTAVAVSSPCMLIRSCRRAGTFASAHSSRPASFALDSKTCIAFPRPMQGALFEMFQL